MMGQAAVTPYLWWLVSRAAGIVAFGLVSIAVVLGLTMAAKVLRPGRARTLVRLHEHIALAGLIAMGVHGVALLADPWLRPGVAGVTIPMAIAYRPAFTAAGIVAAYLAAILGLSFYARRRLGARRWRRLHRATVLVWILGAAHALGAGTDARTLWLRAIVLISAVPIIHLTALRIMNSHRERARPLGKVTLTGARERLPRVAHRQRRDRSATPRHPARTAMDEAI